MWKKKKTKGIKQKERRRRRQRDKDEKRKKKGKKIVGRGARETKAVTRWSAGVWEAINIVTIRGTARTIIAAYRREDSPPMIVASSCLFLSFFGSSFYILHSVM